jgi:hypothetical protein
VTAFDDECYDYTTGVWDGGPGLPSTASGNVCPVGLKWLVTRQPAGAAWCRTARFPRGPLE